MTSKAWEVMNDLEMVTSKICSAREIIDNAVDKIQEHQYDRAETLMVAAYEFLEYYLSEFDTKFKLAWQETVVKEKSLYEEVLEEAKYYGHGKDEVIKWKLPVEIDEITEEYFVQFPDDLLEAAELKEGDQVEWIDNNDGSFILKKVLC